MKTLRILIFGLLATTAFLCRAQITDPGWYSAANLSSGPVARSSFVTNQFQFQALGQPVPVTQPSAPVAETITPQIQALADGLQDNPYYIFNYVHDHIKFVLYFGAKKGANLTLLEKSGNDFDQSALLVALLRAAGYTNAPFTDHGVGYQFGWQEIPYDDTYGQDYDLHHWWQLTLANTNWTNTINYISDLLGTRGYGVNYYVDDGTDNNFELQRTWVVLTVGTNTFQLDPAFKVSEPVAGINLTNALGASSSTIGSALLSAAGGTDTANYCSGLSEAGVRSQLTTYTTNVLNFIQANGPNVDVVGYLGGWQITPAYDPWDFVDYTLFYVDNFGGQMPVLTWTYESTNLMSTFNVAFAGTNYQCFMPQLQGQRMTLTYSNNGVAQLWQEDTLLAQGQASLTGGTNAVVLSVTHPVGSWNVTNNMYIPNPTNVDNSTVTNVYQSTNATYALMYAFEPDWGWLQQRENKLDAYLQQGLAGNSRQVTSETLNIMGLNWLLQSEQAEQMLAAQLNILPMYFQRVGRMAQEAGHGYYVDVYMQRTGNYPSGGDDTPHLQVLNNHFALTTLFASALEHGVIEQQQNSNLVAASTVKMLEIANTNGQTVYLANSTNWSSIQSSLVNYGNTLTQIYNSYISHGYSVLIPANGSNHVSNVAGSWAGYGYAAQQVLNGVLASSKMIIGGGYHGGYVSDSTAQANPYYAALISAGQPTYLFDSPVSTPAPVTADPVDTADATFQVEHTDLALGQAEPRGIALSRYYNGTRRNNNPAGMAPGWVHNYCITANNVPAPQACLGGTTPAQAASMFTATAAAINTYNASSPDAKNWLTTALIAKWGVDQLTKAGVSVSLGKDTLQFVQQPNGVFTPPANNTATLAQNGSAYSLLMRHGNQFNFNSLGLLTNIVDQYGQSLNITYNSSNLVNTVTDWKTRQLTFNYSGTPSRLTSVTDGTRTVNYGYSTAYNSQGDLTSFQDAEGKTCTYQYDTNHQITATWNASSPSQVVVSNMYDTQGHVVTQYTQGDTNKTWRICWSGWETSVFDPANDETDYFYDDRGRLIGMLDPLGYETDTVYDGQNHIIFTQSPLSEVSQFFFDANNNLVQSIDPLGYTNQNIYDTQNNLIATVDARHITNSYGYNAQFSLTSQVNGAGDSLGYNYNPDGTLASRTDAGGTTFYDSYDSYGQLTHITYPSSLGTESFVNSALGDVTSHTDGNGNVTAFYYNNRRELTNTVAPTNITASVAYDANDNIASTTDARGNVTSNLWSVTRHLLATTLPPMPQGAPAATNIYDNRDWLAKSLDPLRNPALYTNDPEGHLISQTDPLLRTTRFSYDADGRKLAAANAGNETNSQTWDARGQLIRSTDGAGHYSTRAYDAAGNQIILTNRNGKLWQFQFDAADRLTNTITPLGRKFSVTFNHQGLPASSKDAQNLPTTYYYDAKGRPTSRTDYVGTTLYHVDANNNLTNVAESSQNLYQGFDTYNRLSSYQDVNGYLIQYRYDANGNLTNLVYPGSRNVYYAYDSENHLTNVTDWAGRQSSVVYDLNGGVTSITRPNGSYRTIAYDAAGQATNIMEQMSNSLPIAIFRYNWTNTGTMAWEFAAPLPHSNSVPTRTMTYDDDNRLTKVNGSIVVNNPDGDMVSGPLTNSTFVTYAYDARNRLLSVAGVTNAYDALNHRVRQCYGTNVTLFVVNPNAKLPQVLMRIQNGATNFYIYGAGLLYQVTETATSTNTLTYHYDYRGSTIALSADSGLITDRIEYSAYGLTTYRAGTNDTPFLFNGRYGVQSDANGLLYMQARYYNPYLCRFVSADPSGFKGGLNLYAYADGNPVSYLDPFGFNAHSTGESFFSWLGGAIDSQMEEIDEEDFKVDLYARNPALYTKMYGPVPESYGAPVVGPASALAANIYYGNYPQAENASWAMFNDAATIATTGAFFGGAGSTEGTGVAANTTVQFTQSDVQAAIARLEARGVQTTEVQSSIDPNQVIKIAQAMQSGAFQNALMDTPVIYDPVTQTIIAGNHRMIASEMTGFNLGVTEVPGAATASMPLSSVPLQAGRINPAIKGN